MTTTGCNQSLDDFAKKVKPSWNRFFFLKIVRFVLRLLAAHFAGQRIAPILTFFNAWINKHSQQLASSVLHFDEYTQKSAEPK